MEVRKTQIAQESLLRQFMPADHSDAFTVYGGSDPGLSPDDVMVAFWTDMPSWVEALFAVRNFLVRFVGLKGSEREGTRKLEKCIRSGGSCGFAEVPVKDWDETVILLKDRHLDAYLSVRKEGEGVFTAATLVHCHNRLGRVYFAVIEPFHGIIVRSLLKRVLKKRALRRR